MNQYMVQTLNENFSLEPGYKYSSNLKISPFQYQITFVSVFCSDASFRFVGIHDIKVHSIHQRRILINKKTLMNGVSLSYQSEWQKKRIRKKNGSIYKSKEGRNQMTEV